MEAFSSLPSQLPVSGVVKDIVVKTEPMEVPHAGSAEVGVPMQLSDSAIAENQDAKINDAETQNKQPGTEASFSPSSQMPCDLVNPKDGVVDPKEGVVKEEPMEVPCADAGSGVPMQLSDPASAEIHVPDVAVASQATGVEAQSVPVLDVTRPYDFLNQLPKKEGLYEELRLPPAQEYSTLLDEPFYVWTVKETTTVTVQPDGTAVLTEIRDGKTIERTLQKHEISEQLGIVRSFVRRRGTPNHVDRYCKTPGKRLRSRVEALSHLFNIQFVALSKALDSLTAAQVELLYMQPNHVGLSVAGHLFSCESFVLKTDERRWSEPLTKKSANQAATQDLGTVQPIAVSDPMDLGQWEQGEVLEEDSLDGLRPTPAFPYPTGSGQVPHDSNRVWRPVQFSNPSSATGNAHCRPFVTSYQPGFPAQSANLNIAPLGFTVPSNTIPARRMPEGSTSQNPIVLDDTTPFPQPTHPQQPPLVTVGRNGMFPWASAGVPFKQTPATMSVRMALRPIQPASPTNTNGLIDRRRSMSSPLVQAAKVQSQSWGSNFQSQSSTQPMIGIANHQPMFQWQGSLPQPVAQSSTANAFQTAHSNAFSGNMPAFPQSQTTQSTPYGYPSTQGGYRAEFNNTQASVSRPALQADIANLGRAPGVGMGQSQSAFTQMMNSQIRGNVNSNTYDTNNNTRNMNSYTNNMNGSANNNIYGNANNTRNDQQWRAPSDSIRALLMYPYANTNITAATQNQQSAFHNPRSTHTLSGNNTGPTRVIRSMSSENTLSGQANTQRANRPEPYPKRPPSPPCNLGIAHTPTMVSVENAGAQSSDVTKSDEALVRELLCNAGLPMSALGAGGANQSNPWSAIAVKPEL